MPGITTLLKHKLTQFVLVLVLAFLFFRFGVPAISLAVTGQAAPVPAHLLWTIYMPIVALVMLLFISASEPSWQEFQSPLHTLLTERQRRNVVALRMVTFVALPLLVGVMAFNQTRPRLTPPAELRSIHPAPPSSITLDGETVNLLTAENPFRNEAGEPEADALAAGQVIYGQRCIFCHGDALDGNGLFADALRPRPANFTDPGTIAQLGESYLFWRIAKGGPGLPPEAKGWNSAMPAWEGTLTQDEMWQVILYLYDATGQRPRAAEE